MAEDQLSHFYNSTSWDLSKSHDTYLATLTFTLFGLAIQTSKFDATPFFDGAELTGWGLLLASGLIGMKRQRDTTIALREAATRESIRSSLNKVMDIVRPDTIYITAPDPMIFSGLAPTKRFRPDELIMLLKAKYEVFHKEVEKYQTVDAQQKGRQIWLFVAALVVLMVSRAWQPLTDLWTWLT